MDWNNANGLAAGKYMIDLVNNPKYVEDKDGIAMSLLREGKLAAYVDGRLEMQGGTPWSS